MENSTSSFSSSLEALWGAMVQSFNVDFTAHTIRLDIRIEEGTELKTSTLLFEDVVAFCWVNDWGNDSDRLNLGKWDSIELTSVSSSSNLRIYFSGSEVITKYSANPNIVLEIWNSILLIEAKKCTVDGNAFFLIS